MKPSNLIDLGGRRALVSGAATGIGRAVALRLAQAGAEVVINHLPQQQAEALAVAALIEQGGGRASCLAADVSQAAEVKTLAERAGRIDILVNNAGIIQEKPFLQTSEADWDRMLAVDLTSVFLMCQAFVPGMLTQGQGVVVNIASDLGLLGRADCAPYCAAKAGVIGLTKSLAREFALQGLRFNAIAPGPVATDMLSLAHMSAAAIEKELDIPMRRFAQADEIAATALFLVSDLASYFCGQVLGPNGGSVML